jgi:hypothetical protein
MKLLIVIYLSLSHLIDHLSDAEKPAHFKKYFKKTLR